MSSPKRANSLEECLAIRRRIGDSRGTGLAQANLGNLAVAEGDPPSARVLLEESAAAFRRRGDMWGYGAALGNLASLAIADGDLPLARRQLEESLDVDRTVRRHRWLAWGLVQLAAVTRLDGQPERAVAMRNEALEIFGRLGDRQGEAAALALEVPPVTRRRPATRQRSARRPTANGLVTRVDPLIARDSVAVTSVFSPARQGSGYAMDRELQRYDRQEA